MRALLLVMLSTLAGSARAESVPNGCTGSWWEAIIVPLEVMTAHALPKVALPVVWNGDVALMSDAERTTLTVEVRDGSGAEVPGAVGIGFDGPWRERLLSHGSIRGDRLWNGAWWQPAAVLSPGRYTLRVTHGAPDGAGYQGCYYAAREAGMTFEVLAEWTGVLLTVEPSLVAEKRDGPGYTDSCGYDMPLAWCEDRDICCFYPLAYRQQMRFAIANLVAGWSYYHVLDIEYDSIAHPYESAMALQHPFPFENEFAPEVYTLVQTFNPAPWQYPLPSEICARGHVVDITDGSISLAFDECVPTRDAQRVADGLVCDEALCAAARAPIGPEPSDAETTEAGERAEAVADPGPDGESGGCGAGATTGLGVLALFARLRRGRDPRGVRRWHGPGVRKPRGRNDCRLHT